AQIDNFRSDGDEEEESQINNLRYNDAYVALDNVLHRLETTLAILKDAETDADNLLRRTRQLRFDLNFIVKAEDKQFVYWIERRGRGVFLRASPIDVSGLLQDKLFEKVPTVILTSATLSSAGNFRFIRERLGLDERGEQLSCVIIDKLPFAVPSDPIIAARQRHIEEQGGSSFYEYSVPQAIISLKQGLGRLIRSTTDRGVLAVLDPRLRTKMYGQTFLQSLPPCRITSEIDELARVFETHRAAAL